MTKLLTRDELDTLRTNDYDAYKKEIAKDWETQKDDIAKVKAIMACYEDSEKEHSLMVGEKPFPKWALDAYEYFTAKYGTQYGAVVYEKVLSKVWGEININIPQFNV